MNVHAACEDDRSAPQQHPAPDVSVVVVSYNTKDYTLACLESLLDQTERASMQVIVLDNASTDGSADAIAEKFADIELIRSPDNLGFAGANNVAARSATGRYILLLNPDTVVLDGAVDKLVEFADSRPDAGIYGGRTQFADGSLNRTSCWGKPSLWGLLMRATGIARLFRGSAFVDPESLGSWARDSVREVATVSGCFLLIKRDLWESLDGFDLRFVMYAEEVDLCIRARAGGSRPVVTPDATIIHHGGASESCKPDQIVRQFTARVRLMHKHWNPVSAWLGAHLLTLWAINKRLRAGLFVRSSSETAQVWREILARRREWMRELSPDTSRS